MAVPSVAAPVRSSPAGRYPLGGAPAGGAVPPTQTVTRYELERGLNPADMRPGERVAGYVGTVDGRLRILVAGDLEEAQRAYVIGQLRAIAASEPPPPDGYVEGLILTPRPARGASPEADGAEWGRKYGRDPWAMAEGIGAPIVRATPYYLHNAVVPGRPPGWLNGQRVMGRCERWSDGTVRIVLNEALTPQERWDTLAHELGHYLHADWSEDHVERWTSAFLGPRPQTVAEARARLARWL